MQCRSMCSGVWSIRSHMKVTKLSEQVESVTQPATSPSCTFSPANRTTVPLRSYSNSRRSAIPGTAGLVGLMRVLAWIEVFSFIDQTTAFSGGLRYRPHTSPAFSQKSGSWLVIHDSTCHGLRSNALQMRHTWEAEIATPLAFIAAASASIVQRVEPSGGGSVTVLTNSNTSSWSYTHGRPGRP